MSEKPKYKIGATVYVVVDEEQTPRMVTGIMIRPQGYSYYCTDYSGLEASFYDIELTNERSILV